MLGLALSPHFETDRFVYVYYTYRSGSDIWNRVVRLKDRDGVGSDLHVIIDRIPGAAVHDGGRIRFGPDEKLYITTGDAGNAQLAQDLESLAGRFSASILMDQFRLTIRFKIPRCIVTGIGILKESTGIP